jgi:integrative and conjugative element protein (TIGR02256 family)
MTRERPDLDAPWWVQFPERLEAEARRFQEEFRPPFELLHDPRSPQERPEAYCKGNFVWRGQVSVKLGRVKSTKERGQQYYTWTVDFVYPPTYPYRRVEVHVVEPPLEPGRHIIGRDEICYISDNPNRWTPDTTNTEVLQRVHNWFIGHLSDWTLGRHVDVPEYAIYLGAEQENLSVLLPEHLYESPPKGSGAGLLDLHLHVAHERCIALADTLHDLRWHTDAFCNTFDGSEQTLLGCGTLHKRQGVWFDVERQPEPIQTTSDLFELFSTSGPFAPRPNPTAWLEKQLARTTINGKALVFVRFRVDKTGDLQWTGFSLEPMQPTAKLPTKGSRAFWKQEGVRRSYRHGRLRALSLYPLRKRDLFRRLQGIYEAEALHGKHVAVIGLGTVGSTATILLAKAGVGTFTVCDGDNFAPWNVMRHELDLRFVGRNKAEAVAKQIKLINPYADTRVFEGIVRSVADVKHVIDGADVVLVAIADKSMEELINRVALHEGKTVLYGRGLARMMVARVARVIPGRDACTRCLDRHLKGEDGSDNDRYIFVEEPGAEWVFDDGCGNAAVPGAGVDTQMIGNLLTRRAIEILHGADAEENHWVHVARSQPFAADPRLHGEGITYSQYFEPFEDCSECSYCQGEHEQKAHHRTMKPADDTPETPPYDRVEIAEASRSTIVEECAACGRLETGGILAGYVDVPRRTLVITHATDAGPNATHRRSYFQRDRAYCQEALDRIFSETNGRCDYVGEWHKHVSWDNSPSDKDKTTLVNVATQQNYHITQSAMLICGMPNARRPQDHRLSAYSFRRDDNIVRELPLSNT